MERIIGSGVLWFHVFCWCWSIQTTVMFLLSPPLWLVLYPFGGMDICPCPIPWPETEVTKIMNIKSFFFFGAWERVRKKLAPRSLSGVESNNSCTQTNAFAVPLYSIKTNENRPEKATNAWVSWLRVCGCAPYWYLLILNSENSTEKTFYTADARFNVHTTTYSILFVPTNGESTKNVVFVHFLAEKKIKGTLLCSFNKKAMAIKFNEFFSIV